MSTLRLIWSTLALISLSRTAVRGKGSYTHSSGPTYAHPHARTHARLPAHTHISEVLSELHLQCDTNHIICIWAGQRRTDAPSTTVCSTALLSICSSLSTWEKSTSELEEARETRASSFIFCRQEEGSRPANGVTDW